MKKVTDLVELLLSISLLSCSLLGSTFTETCYIFNQMILYAKS